MARNRAARIYRWVMPSRPRAGFAHPCFIDMLALSFISVMILFMLFISRNKWEQQARRLDFLRVEISVVNGTNPNAPKTPADGSLSMWLIAPPPHDGERAVFSYLTGITHISLGTDSAAIAEEDARYHALGGSLPHKPMAFCELSEGIISGTGTWALLAHYIPNSDLQQSSNHSWHVRVLFNRRTGTGRELSRIEYTAGITSNEPLPVNPLDTAMSALRADPNAVLDFISHASRIRPGRTDGASTFVCIEFDP